MKKGKRVLAIVGVVLLVAMYLATIILAIVDSSDSMRMFYASIVATILIPVLIWVYTFIYKLFRRGDSEQEADQEERKSDQEEQESEQESGHEEQESDQEEEKKDLK